MQFMTNNAWLHQTQMAEYRMVYGLIAGTLGTDGSVKKQPIEKVQNATAWGTHVAEIRRCPLSLIVPSLC
jgi:hypothetical protein